MKVLLTATVQSHICQFHKPLAEVLHAHGCEVHVAARDNLAEKNGLKLDFADKIFDVPFARSPKSTDNIRAYRQLKKIIADGDYDVIHCNTPMGGIVTRLAARKARKKRTKVYYTAHGFHFYQGAPKKNWIVFYPIEKMMACLTDKLVTITEEDYHLASEKFPCEVYHVHGVGVKTAKYDSVTEQQALDFRKKQGWEDRFIILCTGELNKNKNQSTLLRAMPVILQKVPNAKLLLAGNGPEEANLRTMIAELGLEESAELLGYRTDLEWYVHACDITATASFREGLPVNVLEAMYCGKAVVASENRGHRELVRNGENGWLVSPDDSAGFAEKVCRLFENPKELECFGMCGKELVAAYTDSSTCEELEKVYGL